MPLWPRLAAILNLRSETGASHHQYGKETASENDERKAKARPPHGHAGVLNEPVMKEIVNSVSREASHRFRAMSGASVALRKIQQVQAGLPLGFWARRSETGVNERYGDISSTIQSLLGVAVA